MESMMTRKSPTIRRKLAAGSSPTVRKGSMANQSQRTSALSKPGL